MAHLRKGLTRVSMAALLAGLAGSAVAAADGGLIFRASGDKGFDADAAGAEAAPIFSDRVSIVPDGAVGPAIKAEHEQLLAWEAPGNLYAQRGAVAFFWRAREPVGRNEFPIFRVGYPDHTSWDMVFLRIDWNGRGYEAFVTDANLARTRVSFELPGPPHPAKWTHLAFAWDETKGVQLWVDGKPVARKAAKADLDSGLYAFGPHSRIISGYQVQSAYNFMRGGDVDELRIYDHMLGDADVAALARKETPVIAAAPARDLSDPVWRNEWWSRYGFNRPNDPPPYLSAAATRIRKVEFTEAYDLKQRFFRGSDGMRETTWPGVYNRSRLPGRDDYFKLPDWNVYSQGGKALTISLPDEPWNRLEVQGAAAGPFTYVGANGDARLGERPPGQSRTTLQLGSERRGGKVRFDNRVQETPIQEIAAYNVTAGAEPQGVATLSYTVRPGAAADYPTLDELNGYIAGRHVADERSTVVALPNGAPQAPRRAAQASGLPLVHVLIPVDFRHARPGGGYSRFAYGWKNLNAGLDGVAIELPALKVKATHGDYVPLNIRVKDPLWPDRDLLDINVSVKPGEARTLWLDTRDRVLPDNHSFYMTIAAAGQDFGPQALDGARIRLVFKDRADAAREHVTDRFEQVRDNLSFFVEEQPSSHKLPVYERYERDITDLLRVDPNHELARAYWSEQNGEQPYPAFTQPQPTDGTPLWAFRQLQDLKLVSKFVNWWIDNRQVDNGEFGGGLSDDTDMLAQWPPLALMGVQPDKITDSVKRMLDAVYANGMFTNGLSTIKADELHSYEEGVNGIAEAIAVDWGSPKQLERAMETARNYGRITEVNPAGHRHFVTSYYSATDIVRESVWQWQKPPSFLILHPGLQLVQFNGSPALRKLILELADGYLGHGVPGPNGSLTLPTQIYWPTDDDRAVTGVGAGTGIGSATGVFWAAYRWTGDEKYLKPLLSDAPGGLVALGPDVVSALDRRDTWGQALVKVASAPDPYQLSNTGGAGSPAAFARHVAWQTTGDKRYLEAIYAREIQTASQRMFMMTEGHLWSDRVQIPSEMLQRARLGGVAYRRNQIYGGNAVSWRFDGPVHADQVGILMPEATPTRFKVIAYNTASATAAARLIGGDLTPGRWRMTGGVDANGDDKADAPTSQSVELETGSAVLVSFAPRQTTVLEFSLEQAATSTWERPDVGLDPEDVRLARGSAQVTVHSLGGVAAQDGQVILEDASGQVLARAAFGPLPAPTDLLPKTREVRLALPRGFTPAGARVRLQLDGRVKEITQRNNVVALGGGS
jgi:hypothetical protein